MSTTKQVWTAGQGIMVEDLGTQAAAAAAAPDRVLDAMFPDENIAAASTVGTFGAKTVTPLFRSFGAAGATAGGSTTLDTPRPNVLVVPSLTALGGTDGKLLVLPALYQASAVPSDATVGAHKVAEGHSQFKVLETDALGSNSSGSTKYVLAYGSIAYANATTGSRLVRDANDVDSTQTLTLTQETGLTLHLSTQQTSRANALAQLPADGAGVYNFPLGYVVVNNGYSAGTAVKRNSAAAGGSDAYIEQAWAAGKIPNHRIRSFEIGTVATSAAVSGQAILLSSRMGSKVEVLCPFKHTTNPQTINLDDNINWARRKLTIKMLLPAADGGLYKSPDNVTAGGVAYQTVQQVFSGSENQSFIIITLGGKNYTFKTDASGVLQVTCGAGPNDAVNGDNWWVEVEATAPFDKGAF